MIGAFLLLVRLTTTNQEKYTLMFFWEKRKAILARNVSTVLAMEKRNLRRKAYRTPKTILPRKNRAEILTIGRRTQLLLLNGNRTKPLATTY